MAQKEQSKVERSVADLKKMLAFYDTSHGDEPAAYFAVVKAFEVSIEYAWKELKLRLEEKGITDLYAPKDVIRKAAQTGFIEDAQRWLDYVDARNASVHDYYGMTQAEYVALARLFLKDARKPFPKG
jgi:nucleotidyltransferase substrate binding protein (TIGR01987 family)